ncbi:hypothetical protein AAE478_001898 [Parahypoxylon ruwenzoriense]
MSNAITQASSSSSSSSSSNKDPVVRRPDTGCTVTLGSGLMPSGMSHTEKCKCVQIDSPEELERSVNSARNALKIGVFDSDKPSKEFAMLLLGCETGQFPEKK